MQKTQNIPEKHNKTQKNSKATKPRQEDVLKCAWCSFRGSHEFFDSFCICFCSRLFVGFQAIPSDLKGIPSDLKGIPSDLRGMPSDLKGVPSDFKGVPSDF